jgi:hypothetical protein
VAASAVKDEGAWTVTLDGLTVRIDGDTSIAVP